MAPVSVAGTMRVFAPGCLSLFKVRTDGRHLRGGLRGIHLLRASEMLLSSNRLFASMYLLSHGATKVILVVALWMNALWGYPLTIFVFGAFGAYQMYRYSDTHSIAMLLHSIFDAALIYLTWMEWREQNAEKRSHSAPIFLVR